jgi:hypothetical protein
MIREELLEAAAAADAIEAKLGVMRDLVQVIVLRSFHESGAFGSVALAGEAASRFGGNSLVFARDLEFVLTSKQGYAPEKWLFKAQRYLRFSGLEARIAFARRGNLHSGWVKPSGLAAAAGLHPSADEALGFRILVDAAPVGPVSSTARIVEAGGTFLGLTLYNRSSLYSAIAKANT